MTPSAVSSGSFCRLAMPKSHTFTLSRIAPSGPRVVGLPTLWAELPEPFRKDNPNTWRQRTADTEVKRTYNKPSAGSRETLTSRVLYRGHVATRTTPAVFSGDPTIEYTHVPPTAAPRMAAVAGKGVAKGAVTILVDRSESMKEVVVRDGRIVSVGANVQPPPGARVWDCTGLHIYAGFVEPYLEVDAPQPDPTFPSTGWPTRVTAPA